MGKRHFARERAHRTWVAFGLLSALLGCERKQPPAPPAQAPAEAAAEAAAPAAGSAQPQGLTEPELRAFLQRWLDAQNQSDYSSYADLYAQKFFGVKRAGRRETRFAREGWLADRKRMFQKPMTVEAKEPRFRLGGSSAEIEFTQRFASGTFADEGQKRLLVVREAGALKLAHEEMLRSRETATPSPALNAAFDLHFVVALESGLYVVLEPETQLASSARVRGERAANGDDPAVIIGSRALDPDSLTPALAAWKGARLRLDTGCSATLGKFRLLSRVDPHFGVEQEWANEYGERPRASTQQEIHEAAFEMGERAVVAELRGCSEGSFAQRETSAPPVRAERVEDAELAARARSAFSKLPEVKESQASFVREVEGASGKWWEPSLEVEIYRHPQSRQTLVMAHAALEGEACADFAAWEWAFFELRGKQLTLLRTLSIRGALEQVFDVNGDGRLELILEPNELGAERELVSPDPGGPEATLRYSYQDCPC